MITPAGRTASIDNVGPYLAQIRGTTGVKAATGVYRVGTQVSYGARSGSWPVEAIDPVSYRAVFATLDNIVEGRALTPQDTNQVLLGIGIAGAGETDVRGYRASLQTVHSGARVSVTLVNGRSVPSPSGHLQQPVPAVRQRRLPHHDRSTAAARQPGPRHRHLRAHPQRGLRQQEVSRWPPCAAG